MRDRIYFFSTVIYSFTFMAVFIQGKDSEIKYIQQSQLEHRDNFFLINKNFFNFERKQIEKKKSHNISEIKENTNKNNSYYINFSKNSNSQNYHPDPQISDVNSNSQNIQNYHPRKLQGNTINSNSTRNKNYKK